MGLPLIMLCGQAGSGKDTVAGFLVKNHQAVTIAMADPMKRLAMSVFGYNEEQLWGPSDKRNAKDGRLGDLDANQAAAEKLRVAAYTYVRHVLPDAGLPTLIQANERLLAWGADILKDAMENSGLSARKLLQTLGTEWGRSVSKDVWINYAKRVAMQLMTGGFKYDKTLGLIEADKEVGSAWVVITDGRFRNEVISVLATGGCTWKVVSPDADGKAAEAAGVVGHASESEQRSIPDNFFSIIMNNDKTRGLKSCEEDVTGLLLAHMNQTSIDGRFPQY